MEKHIEAREVRETVRPAGGSTCSGRSPRR